MWTSRSNFRSANMERWTAGLDAGGVEVGESDGADGVGAGELWRIEGEDRGEQESSHGQGSDHLNGRARSRSRSD